MEVVEINLNPVGARGINPPVAFFVDAVILRVIVGRNRNCFTLVVQKHVARSCARCARFTVGRPTRHQCRKGCNREIIMNRILDLVQIPYRCLSFDNILFELQPLQPSLPWSFQCGHNGQACRYCPQSSKNDIFQSI